MDDMWIRFTSDMVARVSGPMKFRLVLQPAMAAFFAIRAGLADARAGRPPYFWALASGSAPREAMIENGWKSVGRVFILAMASTVFLILVLAMSTREQFMANLNELVGPSLGVPDAYNAIIASGKETWVARRRRGALDLRPRRGLRAGADLGAQHQPRRPHPRHPRTRRARRRQRQRLSGRLRRRR